MEGILLENREKEVEIAKKIVDDLEHINTYTFIPFILLERNKTIEYLKNLKQRLGELG